MYSFLTERSIPPLCSAPCLRVRMGEHFMPGKHAKILSKDDLQDLLVYATTTRNPIRNRVIVLLSAKAGLRAGEIANLTWDMILEPNGAISTVIELHDHAAKKHSGRLIPLHKDLRDA